MSGGWLHRGAIICPSCNEICGDYFERRGIECKIREEAPPANKYPRDDLHCDASNQSSWQLTTILSAAILLSISKSVLR